jgi:NADH-quinone oxidoreductase subunit J
LFVVMMLDINIDTLRQGFWNHFPLAATIGTVIALELAGVLLGGFRASAPPAVQAVVGAPVVQASNTKDLGIALYTHYLYPLEIAAVILLVAIIAAIALTLRERKDSKSQDPSQQVRVKAGDRFELVKMDAVKQLPSEPPAQEKQV